MDTTSKANVLAATDKAMDELEATAKVLKQHAANEVKRVGFDLDRLAGEIAKWQRGFRLALSTIEDREASLKELNDATGEEHNG